MNRGILRMFALLLVVLLALVCVPFAQVQKDKSGLDSLEGTVRGIDKDTSTITLQQKGTAGPIWKVTYDKDTKFSYRNSASTLDEVKENRRVVCLGKAGETGKFEAARVDVRTKQ